ncbi:MAG: hypothetical protein ABFS38_20150 [Bacteroidota bacterium]
MKYKEFLLGLTLFISPCLEAQEAYVNYEAVKENAYEILESGFNAGDGYNQVWARDLNTFIKFSCRVVEQALVRDALLKFFFFQGFDGNMIDGYEEVPPGYQVDNYGVYQRYDMPGYVFHKNTVETDQETSLIQAVYKYIGETGDQSILTEEVNGMTVVVRLEKMLDFLMKHRYNTGYGLIWGATTVDWGDVQPKHPWGVKLDDQSTVSIDVYDNAMMLIAIDNFMEMSGDPTVITKWEEIHAQIRVNTRKHLWDEENQKFKPHIYIECNAFDEAEEDQIYYHGGTIVAMEAGLLSKEEIIISLQKMRENVRAAGAQSIGLTIYPAYPEGSFENKGMGAYQYQNGGDWTWFGARIIPVLVKHGLLEDAVTELDPFITRVLENGGFFEWYTIDGQPKGSGIFRGSAGVLLEAMEAIQSSANQSQ